MAEKDGEFCGFAVTDVAAPERLGPMGVSPEVRKLGVGTVLLKRALADLRARGVETGVIYGAGPYAFYARTVNATINAVFWRLRKAAAVDSRTAVFHVKHWARFGRC